MTILWEAGVTDEDMLIAAILHDVVEDTPVGLLPIQRRFGDVVEALVWQLTDKYTSEAYPNINRRERKRLERERVAETSPEAQTIKYADLISNTRSIVKHDKGFARVYLNEKEAILDVARNGAPKLRVAAELALQEGQRELMQESLR